MIPNWLYATAAAIGSVFVGTTIYNHFEKKPQIGDLALVPVQALNILNATIPPGILPVSGGVSVLIIGGDMEGRISGTVQGDPSRTLVTFLRSSIISMTRKGKNIPGANGL